MPRVGIWSLSTVLVLVTSLGIKMSHQSLHRHNMVSILSLHLLVQGLSMSKNLKDKRFKG